MGALKGTLTYTTYFVMQEPESGFRETFMDSLYERRFRDIDIENGRDNAIGWVSVDDAFNTEMDWNSVYRDPYICFALREDKIRIPTPVLKAYLRRREIEFLEETGKEALSRSERSMLKQDVVLSLRRRALPDIKVFDVVWNPKTATVRLWTHSKRVREVFEELFHASWGIRIVAQSPYTLALDGAEDPDKQAAGVMDIVPASLVESVGE